MIDVKILASSPWHDAIAIKPVPELRASRRRFYDARQEMAQAWIEELPNLTRDERWQDMADTHYLLDHLSDFIDQGGRP